MVWVSQVGVAFSGDGLRRFEHDGVRYGHILDPRTGWPVANGMRGVSVLAPTCLQAGIYSTAIFVLGPSTVYANSNTAAVTINTSLYDTWAGGLTPG